MKILSSTECKKLRSLAHHLQPVVRIGRQGISETLLREIRLALDSHELIKVKFVEFKEEKGDLIREVAEKTESQLAGLVGHIAILYRQQSDPEKRKIQL